MQQHAEALNIRREMRMQSTIEQLLENNRRNGIGDGYDQEESETVQSLSVPIIERVFPDFLDLFPQVQVISGPTGMVEHKRRHTVVVAKTHPIHFDYIKVHPVVRMLDASTFTRLPAKSRDEVILDILEGKVRSSVQDVLNKGLWYIAYDPIHIRINGIGISAATRYAEIDPKTI